MERSSTGTIMMTLKAVNPIPFLMDADLSAAKAHSVAECFMDFTWMMTFVSNMGSSSRNLW